MKCDIGIIAIASYNQSKTCQSSMDSTENLFYSTHSRIKSNLVALLWFQVAPGEAFVAQYRVYPCLTWNSLLQYILPLPRWYIFCLHYQLHRSEGAIRFKYRLRTWQGLNFPHSNATLCKCNQKMQFGANDAPSHIRYALSGHQAARYLYELEQ